MTFHWLKTHWFSLLLAALLLLATVAKYRGGIVRVDGVDLALPYAGARAWLAGENPYDGDVLLRHFLEGGGKNVQLNTTFLPPIYPPITFVVMTPLALLSWDHALQAWELVALVMIILMAGSLLTLAEVSFRDPRAWLFILFCIPFGPLRSAIALGQNALPAICLVTMAALVLRWRKDAVAGVLLGIAIAFKLQDASFLALYLLLTRRWRAIAWCAGVLAAVSLIAVITPGKDPRWVFDVLHWLTEGSRPGSIMDPASPNLARFQMVHLPVLLFTLFSHRTVVSLFSFAICGTMLIFTCRLILQRPKDQPFPDLLALGLLAVLSLLSVYHRFPDAILLLLPVAWAISTLGTSREYQGRIVLLPSLLFLMEPNEVFPRLVRREIISRATFDSWWFQCFARASLVWMLLFLALWLLYCIRRKVVIDSRPE